MAVSTVNNSSSDYSFLNANKSEDVKTQAQQDSEMFMQLMIAQLKNQDPTNPSDTTDFMQQIATMSNVEGINKLVMSVDDLKTTMINSQNTAQASTMVGKTVFVEGNTVDVSASEAGRATISLDTSEASVSVDVFNSFGEQVDTLDLGALAQGDHRISLDAEKYGEGEFKLVVNTSTSLDGGVAPPLYVGKKVETVTIDQITGGLTANTKDGSYAASTIHEIG